MQIGQKAIPVVWAWTSDPAFNRTRYGGYARFLSDEQAARLERIRQARLLFDGEHRQYYLDEARTEFDFQQLMVQGNIIQPYSTINVLGLSSRKFADLLFGAAPTVSVDDQAQQGALDDLVKRNKLQSLLHNCAADASADGECFLESVIFNGHVYLRQLDAAEVFPEGDLEPDGQYRSYVRYLVSDIGTRQSPLPLLLEMRYLAGSIERRCYQLGQKGERIQEVSLDYWPLKPGQAKLQPLTRTGLTRNLITWIPNMLSRGRAVSDYDGSALRLQDKLNAKDTQIDCILAKHADPTLAVPARAADDKGNARSRYKVWWYDEPESIPKYIVRDLQLEAPIADARRALNNLCIVIEMSPVLLGIKEGAAPDAYKKVRLESFNAIKKAERKAAYWTDGLTRALEVAQDLEQMLPTGISYRRWPIAVEVNDGIPQDAVDVANELSILRAAGLLSRRKALTRLYGDSTAVEDEIQELEAEAKANTPNILIGEPGETPEEPVGETDMGDDQ